MQEITDRARQILKALQEQALAAKAIVQSGTDPGSEYSLLASAWKSDKERYDALYAAAKAASTAHASKLEELAVIERRQQDAAASTAQQRAELAKLGKTDEAFALLRREWLDLSAQRSEVLREQCDAQTELSEGLIKASLKRGEGLTAISDQLRVSVAGSGMRSAKLDAIVEGLAQTEDPGASWEVVLHELEMLSQFDPAAEKGLPTCTTLRSYSLAEGDIRKIAIRLTPESWLDLALTPLADTPSFEYKTKEGEYIDFALASAGQQATALLTILLNQSGPPLIIDQPEDDLDSQVIQDVIARIWKAKSRRQLVFSSHNANLVVNGDAELVVCCDYRAMGDQSGGRIKLEGAIDMADVKQEITVIMEGGEKAFRLRKDKYGF